VRGIERERGKRRKEKKKRREEKEKETKRKDRSVGLSLVQGCSRGAQAPHKRPGTTTSLD
jgi:hypothetical protein